MTFRQRVRITQRKKLNFSPSLHDVMELFPCDRGKMSQDLASLRALLERLESESLAVGRNVAEQAACVTVVADTCHKGAH